jgi:hypothetical protein
MAFTGGSKMVDVDLLKSSVIKKQKNMDILLRV